jgi:HlyD family secretion protein
MSNQSATMSARGHLILGFFALIILLGGFAVWATFTEISGAIIASGRIEVDRNRQVVQHLDGGTVSEILVDEGDSVVRGDVLIRLDDTLLHSELLILESQLYETMARRGRLEAERDELDEIVFEEELIEVAKSNSDVADVMSGQVRLFNARKSTLEKELDQLGRRRLQIADQILGIQSQQDALDAQLELLNQELESQQSLLNRGLAQAGRVLALQREAANLEGEVGELVAAKAQSEGRITEIDIEILRRGTLRREEAIGQLRDLQLSEHEILEQRNVLNERLSRLAIKAPVSGIIYGLTVFAEQSVVRAAEPLMFLVPQDRPLVIASQIEPIHIEQVHLGQEVILRFSTFDQRTTPELYGRVTQVSADIFVDEGTRQGYYRAEIVLNEGEADRLPENKILIPGMPVEAFIRTDDRTPIAYLIKPFTDYLAKAFRES